MRWMMGARQEIERLQRYVAERDHYRRQWSEGQAEIQRLQRDLAIWERSGGDILQQHEIERLRVELAAERERCIRMVFAYVDDVKDAQATAAAIREGE